MPDEKKIPILVSLGQTYLDVKDYENSVQYFLEECKMQRLAGNFEHVRTDAADMCQLAKCESKSKLASAV